MAYPYQQDTMLILYFAKHWNYAQLLQQTSYLTFTEVID